MDEFGAAIANRGLGVALPSETDRIDRILVVIDQRTTDFAQ